jgi:two-component system, LytTR family, response regulator
VSDRIRTLIVDDEPLAREGLRLLLAADADIEVVGECASGREAVGAIGQLRPALAFLDVQMPGLDGFAVLAALPEAQLPRVVFVTAHDRHAVRAFEVQALDYLLKPFDDDRFYEVLARAKARPELRPRAPWLTRLQIKDGGRILFLELDEVEWIEAADYYVELHVAGRSYLHRETMASLETRLDPGRFVRIHRSAIVNQRFVRELRPRGERDLVCVLASGATHKVARSQREKLRATAR